MAYVVINEQHLTDIANAIRSKGIIGEETELFKPREMAPAIESIPVTSNSYCINIETKEFPDYMFGPLNSSMLTTITHQGNEYTFEHQLTTIGSHACDGAKNLNYVELPSSVTTIKDYAFANCTALKYFYINSPIDSITIDSTALEGCSGVHIRTKASEEEAAAAGAPWGATNVTYTYNYVPDYWT